MDEKEEEMKEGWSERWMEGKRGEERKEMMGWREGCKRKIREVIYNDEAIEKESGG